MQKKIFILTPALAILLAKQAAAHCPLCTMAAAAGAGTAVMLGVNQAAIGVFIVAFAVAIGFWIARLIKKKYIPLQKQLIILASFLTTVLPLLPIMQSYFPINIAMMGDYGSLLNSTYAINSFLFGSILGSIILAISPLISNAITKTRKGKTLPFQGITITFLLLIIAALLVQEVI